MDDENIVAMCDNVRARLDHIQYGTVMPNEQGEEA